MKTKSVFWGSLFILAGILLLLDNFGILNVDIWRLIWPSFIIAVGAWTLWTATNGTDALEVEELALPLNGTKQGKMTLSFGAGQVKVHGRVAEGELLSGTFVGGVEKSIHNENEFTDLSLQPSSAEIFSKIMPWTWGAREWQFGLSQKVAWQLRFEIGASNTQVDLTDLQVTDLEVDTGASNTEIILPAHAGATHVDLNGGAASVLFQVPEGVAAKIKVDSGLASIDINRTRFPRVGDYYKSDDYETAANKVTINADFGAGSLSIQ